MKMKKVGLRGEDVANVPLLLTSYFGLRTSSSYLSNYGEDEERNQA